MNITRILLLVLLTACAAPKRPAKPAAPPPAPASFRGIPAKIIRIHTGYKFVVLDFRGRAQPAVGTTLSVYRGDKRVGAVRTTEPVRPNFATADITEGDLRVGDEAR